MPRWPGGTGADPGRVDRRQRDHAPRGSETTKGIVRAAAGDACLLAHGEVTGGGAHASLHTGSQDRIAGLGQSKRARRASPALTVRSPASVEVGARACMASWHATHARASCCR